MLTPSSGVVRQPEQQPVHCPDCGKPYAVRSNWPEPGITFRCVNRECDSCSVGRAPVVIPPTVLY